MSNLEPLRPGNVRRARRRLIGLAAACSSLFALASITGSATALAPIVIANPATQVSGGFELSGTIYPYGLDTTYHFEYGSMTSYGTPIYSTNIPVPNADAGSSNGAVPVSQLVTGLQPNTTYHFRIAATNSDGTAFSGDQAFTTPTDPNAPPPTTGAGTKSHHHKVKTVRVREAKNQGRTILTTSNGHTLYSLSAEKHGKFICTKSSDCLNLWKPLMLPRGAKLNGPVNVKLGTIKRPEGGRQITYHGRPLYSFVVDTGRGSVKGEGLKDVGTWHSVTVPNHRR